MNRKVVLWVCSVALISTMVEAEMHAFTLEDGRVLEAEVIGYNTKLGKVELKRQDGKRVKVKPDIFVEADQTYIKEWAMLDGFRNESLFKVDCAKKKVEDWKEENSAFQTQFERFVYEVGLENRNAFPVENLKAEYRIFYEQEKNDSATKKVVTIKNSKPGSLDLNALGAKQKKTIKSESIVLEEFEFNMSDYYVPDGDPESTHGEIKGIWLRLTLKTPGGQSYIRDVYEPASLQGKYAW